MTGPEPRNALPPWIERQLRLLAPKRGHAWLLHGPAGLGQYTLALALARAWLCERPGDDSVACGACASCHAIEVHTHADLAALMPETAAQALGWPLAEKAQKELDEKKRKPSREIRIEALRDAIEFAQRSDARGRGKVVLLYPAERMNAYCANALLKTLEEPPGAVRFILASEDAGALTPTVRSRCQTQRMAWPSGAEIQQWLQAQNQGAQALSLLPAAGNRPELALAWAREGLDAASWNALPRQLAAGQAGVLSAWSPARCLDALQKLCHDALCQAAGAPPRFFSAADFINPRADFMRLSAWARELKELAHHIEHPFSAGLLLDALVAQAQAALVPARPAPLAR